MAITYVTMVMYIFNNSDGNKITTNGIKQLMSIQMPPKLQLLNLSNINILA